MAAKLWNWRLWAGFTPPDTEPGAPRTLPITPERRPTKALIAEDAKGLLPLQYL